MRKKCGQLWGKVMKWAIEVEAKGFFEKTKKLIQDHVSQNRSIFSYTVHKKNGLRHDYVNNIRTGMFYIAKELNIPITFIAIDSIEKGLWDTIPYQKFQMKASKTFYVKDIQKAKHHARVFFRSTLRNFRDTKYDFSD